VGMRALPRAGTFESAALERSYPAERGEPREGITALSESFFTLRKLDETAPFKLDIVEKRKIEN